MRSGRAPLLDVMRALAPGRERRCWHGQGALPLSVRIGDKLCEMLIAACEVQADVTSDEAGPLRAIAPEIEQVVARIDALLKQLAA
jgi:hypothetical protein